MRCPNSTASNPNGVQALPDHRAVMQQAITALSMAHAGLEWYRDACSDQVNGSDDEADETIEAAMNALQAALDADGVNPSTSPGRERA